MWALLLLSFHIALGQDSPAAETNSEQAPQAPLPIVVAPSIVEYVEAVYPENALAEGKEATVRLQINLDETGAVQDVQVIEPVGDGFDEAAGRATNDAR